MPQFGGMWNNEGMRITVLPYGRFVLSECPGFALSETELRTELLKRGVLREIVDDLISRLDRF
jgi:hypothetical protein